MVWLKPRSCISALSLVFTLIAQSLPVVRAQGTNATCQSSWSWSFNSLQQSPCVMASYILATCEGTAFVTSLNLAADITRYNGLAAQYVDHCSCSGVWYTLISACALCQGGQAWPYKQYTQNCTSNFLSIGTFPPGVPSGTAIPAWAFMDVSNSTIFDSLQARQIGDQPERFPGSTGATSTSRGASTGTAAGQITPTASSNSHTNAGAIAGGVIAGVLGICLIALIAVYFLRKQRTRNRNAPPSVYPHDSVSNYGGMEQVTPFPAPSPGLNQYDPKPWTTNPTNKLYDPSDPTTFPSSPAPGSFNDGSTLVSPLITPGQHYNTSKYGQSTPPHSAVGSQFPQAHTAPRPTTGQFAGYPEV